MSLDDAVAYARRRRSGRRRAPSGWAGLSPVELEVVEHVAEGRTNAEISRRLGITLNTVKTHLAHIYAKLGAANRTELAARAMRRDERIT